MIAIDAVAIKQKINLNKWDDILQGFYKEIAGKVFGNDKISGEFERYIKTVELCN